MIKYRIHGRAIETGKAWHGKPIFDTKVSAQHDADTLNARDLGSIMYWIEFVEVEEEQCNPEPSPTS